MRCVTKSRVSLTAEPLYPEFFEALLWTGLFVCGAYILLGSIFHWFLLGMIGAVGVLIGIYGGWIEPYWVQIRFYHEQISEHPQAKMRIVFVSDLHTGGYKLGSFYARIAKLIEAQKPDMLLLGGDFVYAGSSSIRDLYAFKKVSCPMGKYFVLGNHDFDDNPEEIRKTLEEYGFLDATNKHFELKKEGKTCSLVGLDDSWFGDPKIAVVSQGERPTILLTHEPDILADLPEGAADIVLIGHTHGGQIRWPFFGPVSPLPQDAPQFLDQGRRVWRGMPIFISRGLGESGSRVRFLARPEILVADIAF